jgi:hypothetical protein
MAATGQTVSTNVATNIIVVPPGSTPPVNGPDYINRALLVDSIVCVVLLALTFWQRATLIQLKRNKATFHYFIEGSEWVLAIAISLVATFFELYKKDTWVCTNQSLVGSSAILTAVTTIYICVKGLSAAAKKKDSEEIAALQTEKTALSEALGKAERKTNLLVEQRDKVLEVTTYVRKIVDSKMTRLAACLDGKEAINMADITKALDPAGQVNVIIRTTFYYFEKEKRPDAQMRLGIYARNPDDLNELKRIYSWDGKTVDCFKRSGKELGRLDDPEGIKTQLLKSFHSSDTILIIESCPKAAERGEFNYFPGQQNYLKSMMLYKHVFEHNGTKDALILTLDSSEEALFKNKDEQEIRIFLLEMMKRVEFELRFLETLTKVT